MCRCSPSSNRARSHSEHSLPELLALQMVLEKASHAVVQEGALVLEHVFKLLWQHFHTPILANLAHRYRRPV